MYQIFKAEKENFVMMKEFLERIDAIKSIDDEVLLNASIIMNEKNEICGMVSFEKFNFYGFIRYFVFKKNVKDGIIEDLLCSLIETAKSQEIKAFFTIIMDNDILELFKQLGFEKKEKERFYIDEQKVSNTKYVNSTIMLKAI